VPPVLRSRFPPFSFRFRFSHSASSYQASFKRLARSQPPLLSPLRLQHSFGNADTHRAITRTTPELTAWTFRLRYNVNSIVGLRTSDESVQDAYKARNYTCQSNLIKDRPAASNNIMALTKNCYIFTSGRWGHCPYPTQFVGLVKSQPAATYTTTDTPVVISVLCNVPYPWQSLVPTLFYDLQIANLDPRYSEVGYLKFNGDWGPFLYVLLWQL